MSNITIKRSLKFICSILICTLFGGIIGFLSSYFIKEDGSKYQITQLDTILFIALIIVALIEIAIYLYCANCRYRIKKDNYNDEEYSTFDLLESSMSFVNGLGTTLAVTSIPSLSFLLFFPFSSTQHRVYLLLIFFTVTVNTINEIQMLQTIGKVDSKKNVDWSKMNLNQHYYQSLDECEKEKMGIIGAKLVTKIHIIFAILFFICTALSSFIAFSGFEFILLGLLWGFFTFFITLENRKQDNKNRRT